MICPFDLEKGFDTIDHSLLLFKLSKYGIKNSELHWFPESFVKKKTSGVYQR